MISSNRIITVSNGKSKIDEPIIVYRGDYELKVTFTILNNQFEVTNNANLIETENAAFGQLAILTPYGGNIFTSMTECTDGTVSFLLSKEMLDQIEEVGLYSFQIRLFDYNEESRVSIPPVEFGMEVREPIASEDHDNTVDNAIVGYSIARIVDLKEDTVMPTFDLNGNYNKTNWETGDRITEKKLNKIEDAIDKINDNEMNDVTALSKRINNNFNVLDSTKADIFDVNSKIWSMANMGQDVKEAMTGGSVAVVGENTILNENIVDRQIRMEKLANDYEYYVADNGEFGNVDDSGNITGNNDTWTTEFIPVEEGKKYIIQCHYDGEHRPVLATYDSNKTIIKWDLVDTNKLIVFTPSVGASFIRMSMMTVDKGTFRLIPVNNIGREVNTFAGLKINFLGDSITQGVGTTKTYLQFLQEKFGVESRNYGISGSSISDLSTPMFSRALTMDEDADYVFVFGGTNDFNGGVSLGKLYTLSDSTKIATDDTSTFYGALHTLCVNLINRYPDKKIVLMTPIHREHFGGQPTEFETNAQGLYLTDYVNAIKEVGEWYSIPVLDLYATSGLNPNIPIHKEKFFSPTDGLHPKAEGHEVIANRIKAFLNTI